MITDPLCDTCKNQGKHGFDQVCLVCGEFYSSKYEAKDVASSDMSAGHVPISPKRQHIYRQHITDGTKCWCDPALTYVDPVTGAEIWTHREPT